MTVTPIPMVDAPLDEEKSAKKKGDIKEKGKPRVLLTIILGIVSLLWIFPSLGLVITSFRTKADADSTGWWTVFTAPFQQDWTLSNFSTAWESLNVSTYFFNSLAVVIPATVLPIMFAATAAYAFTFFDFKFKEGYFAIILGADGHPGSGRHDPDPAALRLDQEHDRHRDHRTVPGGVDRARDVRAAAGDLHPAQLHADAPGRARRGRARRRRQPLPDLLAR